MRTVPVMRSTLPFLLAVLLSSAGAASITVKPGDTLYGLARQHRTTIDRLVALNAPLNPQRALQVGQRLKVPDPMPAAAPRPATTGPSVQRTGIRVTAVLPVQGRLTSPYSAQHPGLDLAAPTGTPVRAARAGTVTESRFDGRTGWGWTIVVDHWDGLTTRYSHNSAVLAQVGQAVTTGQVIARVGSTGNSTGPHLDYRVMVAGQTINPMRLY